MMHDDAAPVCVPARCENATEDNYLVQHAQQCVFEPLEYTQIYKAGAGPQHHYRVTID
jgi:hypothetical protein